jgi:hypothetical protein
MRRSLILVLAVALAAASVSSAAATVGTANSVAPAWKNCTSVNRTYPHGIGRVGARDKTAGVPVTTFKRSNRLYQVAMNNNKGLDRDKDGVACETP